MQAAPRDAGSRSARAGRTGPRRGDVARGVSVSSARARPRRLAVRPVVARCCSLHQARVHGQGLPARRPRRPLGGAGLGRDAPRAHPPGRAGPDRPRPEPLPHVGRDVGRLGGLRPDGRRLLRHREARRADDASAAREAAISYAAYRILLWRYITVGRPAGRPWPSSTPTMASLCYRTDYVSDRGRLAGGARQPHRGSRSSTYGRDRRLARGAALRDADYKPVNEPLMVAEPGTVMSDPNRWQPLALAHMIAQNGLPIPGKVQQVHRAALGPRQGLRAAGVARPARRSTRARRRCSATRPPTQAFKDAGRRGDPPTAASSTPPTA